MANPVLWHLDSLPRHSPAPCGVLVFAAGQTFRSGICRRRAPSRRSLQTATNQGRDWRAAPSAVRRFPVRRRTAPRSAGQCGDCASGDIAARWSLPVFARNPVRIEIIQPRVGPSRTGEELPWVVVQTNHSTLTGLYRFSAISRRRCLRTAHQRTNAGLIDLIPSGYYRSLLRSLPRHSPTPCGVLVFAAGHQRPGQTFRSGHPPALRRRRGRQ
jgi:hypothetical protein